ncbi:MAG: energy transducer TonB, partial [Verrucomicrobiae bacterium]|nr:energy transducer TonB [Verrucomicrobiae bacterium]
PKPGTPRKAPTATVVAKPRIRSAPKPFYPPDARRNGWIGTVYLKVTISASGQVTDVSVSRSSGRESLDRAAVSTMKRWRFYPAKDSNGQAVPSAVIAPIRFQLQD